MIRLIPVDLVVKTVMVPVAWINGSEGGKNLLITAGIDGDEYSGIEAAYKLVEEFSSRNFKGKLTIIPVVNIPGFEAGLSRNPLDNKFPKLIFPGKKDGLPSERLIYWLAANFIYESDLWLDLHGGASDEVLAEPMLFAFEAKNKKVNKLVLSIIRGSDMPKAVFQKKAWKTDLLAKRDTACIICEAGFSGDRQKQWVDTHLRFARHVMGAIGMLGSVTGRSGVATRIYRRTTRYLARSSGLWYPIRTSLVKKGQVLGEVYSLKGKLLQEVTADRDGEFLWGKESMFCRKSDHLAEIGIEPMTI